MLRAAFDKLRLSGVCMKDLTQLPLMLSLSKHARIRSLLTLTLILSTGTATAQAPLNLPEIDHLVVRKAERSMDLIAAGRVVHTIEGIQLGDAPVGHKQFQGDERTPEGRYTLDYDNPNSSFHLSLHISYPNAQDIAYARAQGRDPGGLVFIHGQPNALPAGRMPGDWTDGCIAVSNDEIEVLWEAVPNGTVIDILP